jgi:hypothetical protein
MFWCRYGAISRDFAPLLRKFCREFMPIGGGVEENWQRCLDLELQLHLQYAPVKGNSTQHGGNF